MTAADPHQWWREEVPEETRARLDESARNSILDGLVGYPYWDKALCAELLAWKQLESDILEAHGDWLARTKAKFERHGWPWTTAELARRSQLWEHE